MRSSFDPGKPSFFSWLGELLEDLSPDDLRKRYCIGREDELAPALSHHLARARVAR
ncbi:MAG: hypothetical protein ACXVUL_01980 [Solirubrobacteraceae bacterium]